MRIRDYPKFKDELHVRAYFEGMRKGIWLYAVWHDGEQIVGSGGKTLREALAELLQDETRILNELPGKDT